MTKITKDHVEWVFVGRLRMMLEEPPSDRYEVSETYALFTTILCWVMQHVRIGENEGERDADKQARNLRTKLDKVCARAEPWKFALDPTVRIERIGKHSIAVPASEGVETHSVWRILRNLRDATAHGDMRTVEPLNTEHLLVGFTFLLAEYKNGLKKPPTWEGKITLLQSDMQRIGAELARRYCNTIRDAHRHNSTFGAEAGTIKERAA
ncbi:MAG: hypothetical protein WCZ23_10745 [Rhodospirillaceae bacterium]